MVSMKKANRLDKAGTRFAFAQQAVFWERDQLR
jgi:hypothetical protein